MQAISGLTSMIPALTAGSQLATGASSMYQGYKNQQYQDQLRDIASNPDKLNAYAQQFVKPLTAGVQKGVGNQAQAYAAERGLAESPSAQSEIVSQAIAPYIQQNQQDAYSLALRALGIGGGAQPQNTQSGLTNLFAGLKGLGGQTNLAAIKNLANSGGPMSLISSPQLTDLINGGGDSGGGTGLNDFYGANFGGADGF